jgi:hypothetical protein
MKFNPTNASRYNPSNFVMISFYKKNKLLKRLSSSLRISRRAFKSQISINRFFQMMRNIKSDSWSCVAEHRSINQTLLSEDPQQDQNPSSSTSEISGVERRSGNFGSGGVLTSPLSLARVRANRSGCLHCALGISSRRCI